MGNSANANPMVTIYYNDEQRQDRDPNFDFCAWVRSLRFELQNAQNQVIDSKNYPDHHGESGYLHLDPHATQNLFLVIKYNNTEVRYPLPILHGTRYYRIAVSRDLSVLHLVEQYKNEGMRVQAFETIDINNRWELTFR